MPKKIIEHYMPSPETIRAHKSLQVLGDVLHQKNLWHLNRNSVARAFAVGLFFAFVPLPFQMLLSASVAILVSANLPLAVALVWLTNPITMPAIFYFAYKLGNLILGIPTTTKAFEFSPTFIGEQLLLIWKPFLTGCGVLALSSAAIGYFTIHLIWRINIMRRWKKRNHRKST